MRHVLLAWIVAGMFGVTTEATAAPEEPTVWKAGVAAVKITPEEPVWMAGYASRKKPSEGVATDLFAKALAIEDSSGTKVVIVTMDLISVPRTLRDRLEAAVQEKYSLTASSLLMNASHTHCGPELRAARLADDELKAPYVAAAERYMADLQQKLVAAVGDALQRLAPARLDFQRARAGFAMNRRRPVGQGYSNAPYFEGPVDQEVPVLRVTDPKGTLVAVMFGYACHTTTMGDYLIRGDYAGYAQQYLEEEHPGLTALFLAGCGGDQNPYPRGRDEYVQHHGRTLALAVEAALQTRPQSVHGPLAAALEDVTLEFAPVPPREELEKTAAAGRVPDSGHAARLLKELDETGEIRSTYPCPVQVIRFGRDLTLIALGGETVVDYSLRLKQELAESNVWVAGYSNDVFTYLPSARVLAEGGYEAGGAARWGSLPGPFTDSVEERVVGKALELARQPID